jgi:hypothetical protein
MSEERQLLQVDGIFSMYIPSEALHDIVVTQLMIRICLSVRMDIYKDGYLVLGRIKGVFGDVNRLDEIITKHGGLLVFKDYNHDYGLFSYEEKASKSVLLKGIVNMSVHSSNVVEAEKLFRALAVSVQAKSFYQNKYYFSGRIQVTEFNYMQFLNDIQEIATVDFKPFK